jgi:hypothetical protein
VGSANAEAVERMSTLGLLLAVLVSANPDLEIARRAFDASRFEEVVPAVRRARTVQLSDAEWVTSYELEALTFAAFDDTVSAQRAFEALLTLRPGYLLSKEASPKVRAAFEAASARIREKSPEVAAVSPSTASESAERLRTTFEAVGVLGPARSVAVDVWGSWVFNPHFDLGLGVGIGPVPSLQVIASARLGAVGPVIPLARLRGLVFLSRPTLSWGGGAWLGVAVPIGPGRLTLGALAELYRPTPGYTAHSLGASGGYELPWRF